MAIEDATVLAECSNRPARALPRLSALLLDDEQAQRLHTEPDAAGLLVERVGYGGDGRALVLSQCIDRGDTCDFVAERSAGPSGAAVGCGWATGGQRVTSYAAGPTRC